jgi:aspartyl/asparaginyl-tRNA synthetase
MNEREMLESLEEAMRMSARLARALKRFYERKENDNGICYNSMDFLIRDIEVAFEKISAVTTLRLD